MILLHDHANRYLIDYIKIGGKGEDYNNFPLLEYDRPGPYIIPENMSVIACPWVTGNLYLYM